MVHQLGACVQMKKVSKMLHDPIICHLPSAIAGPVYEHFVQSSGWGRPAKVQIGFASRFPPRHLEASRSRGFEDCEVSKLRGLSIYDHLSRHPSMRIRTYLLHGEPEGRKPKTAILNPRPIGYCIHSTSFYAKHGSPWVTLESPFCI